jgi:hypothetical protein
MSIQPRGQRLYFFLSAAELCAVDDYRFAARVPNRAAAVRELLSRGLRADFGAATVDTKSSEIDVAGSPAELRAPRKDA